MLWSRVEESRWQGKRQDLTSPHNWRKEEVCQFVACINSIKFRGMQDFSTNICSLRPKVLSRHIWWLNTDLKIPKKWRRLHAVGLVNFFCWQIITLLFFICHYRKSREKCYLRFCYKFGLGKHLLFSYPQGYCSRIGLIQLEFIVKRTNHFWKFLQLRNAFSQTLIKILKMFSLNKKYP